MSFEVGFIFSTEKLNINNNIENRLNVNSKFEIINFLGAGSFGRVNQVIHRQSGEKYAQLKNDDIKLQSLFIFLIQKICFKNFMFFY
jgi:hypothetical protein